VCPLLSFLLLTVLATSARSDSTSPDPGTGSIADTASFANHPKVQAYLRYFQGRGRPSMERWLERGERYVPMIRQRLNDAMLPEELCWLPLIESGFSNGAVSSAGAAGMWQFMPSTARMYGLRVDQYVDERCDPVKATSAAVRHLSDLLERFDSPYLAAAAYNAGTDRVLRGLDRLEGGAKGETGKNQKASKPGPAEDGSTPDSRRVDAAEGGVRFDDADFFRLSDASLLGRETRNYVPQFIAASMGRGEGGGLGRSRRRTRCRIPVAWRASHARRATRPLPRPHRGRRSGLPQDPGKESDQGRLHGLCSKERP
jgi:membrane-bound lytic murein transglycosylase D